MAITNHIRRYRTEENFDDQKLWRFRIDSPKFLTTKILDYLVSENTDWRVYHKVNQVRDQLQVYKTTDHVAS